MANECVEKARTSRVIPQVGSQSGDELFAGAYPVWRRAWPARGAIGPMKSTSNLRSTRDVLLESRAVVLPEGCRMRAAALRIDAAIWHVSRRSSRGTTPAPFRNSSRSAVTGDLACDHVGSARRYPLVSLAARRTITLAIGPTKRASRFSSRGQLLHVPATAHAGCWWRAAAGSWPPLQRRAFSGRGWMIVSSELPAVADMRLGLAATQPGTEWHW